MAHEECTPEAWDFLKMLYLRCDQPTFSSCYRHLKWAAAECGWTIPSEWTLRRRMAADEHSRLLLAWNKAGRDARKRFREFLESPDSRKAGA